MAKQETRVTGHAYLKQLLADRNRYPERAAEIDRLVHDGFNRKVSILVLDMCGFSRTTNQHGVIHFLAMIHQMEQGACLAIAGNNGKVIKQEADNLFAVFSEPAHAVEAALDILRGFEAMNAVLPEERSIHVSIGIGYGDTLVVEDTEMFGHEMNVACKLGEDVASRSEILLTSAAHEALPARRYECSGDTALISGMELRFYRFNSCLYQRPIGS